MPSFFEHIERIREFRLYLEELQRDSPALHSELIDSLQRSIPLVSKSIDEKSDGEIPASSDAHHNNSVEKLTNADRIERFLADNPWKTQKEIAEGTGIKLAIIGATMYAKPTLGRFTSKKDPNNSRGKVWANGESGKPSFVGGKPFDNREKRQSSTDLVFDWLRENGAASVSEIVEGIGDIAQTKSADLRTVVRTLVSRAADDGSLMVDRDASTNLYWVPGFEQSVSIDDAKPGTALAEIRDCFYSNNNDFLTVNQLIEYTGRTMSGIRDVIYHAKYKHLFDRKSRGGPGNQTLFRLKGGKSQCQ